MRFVSGEYGAWRTFAPLFENSTSMSWHFSILFSLFSSGKTYSTHFEQTDLYFKFSGRILQIDVFSIPVSLFRALSDSLLFSSTNDFIKSTFSSLVLLRVLPDPSALSKVLFSSSLYCLLICCIRRKLNVFSSPQLFNRSSRIPVALQPFLVNVATKNSILLL